MVKVMHIKMQSNKQYAKAQQSLENICNSKYYSSTLIILN